MRIFPDEYEVINKGINGDTAYGVLNRLEQRCNSVET